MTMKDSGKTGYDFWGKAHLGRLPNLTEETPRVENPSKRLLMLFPLFKSGARDTYTISEKSHCISSVEKI